MRVRKLLSMVVFDWEYETPRRHGIDAGSAVAAVGMAGLTGPAAGHDGTADDTACPAQYKASL
jgi:hypothetical protein